MPTGYGTPSDLSVRGRRGAESGSAGPNRRRQMPLAPGRGDRGVGQITGRRHVAQHLIGAPAGGEVARASCRDQSSPYVARSEQTREARDLLAPVTAPARRIAATYRALVNRARHPRAYSGKLLLAGLPVSPFLGPALWPPNLVIFERFGGVPRDSGHSTATAD